MASTGNFQNVGHLGTLILNNANGTTITSSIITGVATGTVIKELRVYSGPTTAPGVPVLNIVLDDGVNQVTIASITCVNTANIEMGTIRFDNLTLPSTAYSLKAIVRTAVTSGATLHISVFGADL